jgi:dTDP-4-dehydrorhamnose 3,5-epimerase
LVDLEPHHDYRGNFARVFDAKLFAERGVPLDVAQANVSYNYRAGTLRGLHYQVEPALEAKFIRCVSGALYDVIIDMRPDSPTHLQWFGTTLSAMNGRALYVPEMFAHGYLTLTADVLAYYQVSQYYTPGTERGLRYDDPALGITWPVEPVVISEKDRSWTLLGEGEGGT